MQRLHLGSNSWSLRIDYGCVHERLNVDMLIILISIDTRDVRSAAHHLSDADLEVLLSPRSRGNCFGHGSGHQEPLPSVQANGQEHHGALLGWQVADAENDIDRSAEQKVWKCCGWSVRAGMHMQ